jgi:hypothetical protein
VETDTTMKIEQGGLRQHLLDDFHRGLKKSAQRTLRLFHSYGTGPTTVNLTTHFQEAAAHLKVRVFWSEEWGALQEVPSDVPTSVAVLK